MRQLGISYSKRGIADGGLQTSSSGGGEEAERGGHTGGADVIFKSTGLLPNVLATTRARNADAYVAISLPRMATRQKKRRLAPYEAKRRLYAILRQVPNAPEYHIALGVAK